MQAASYKRNTNKVEHVQDRKRHKGCFCISDKWLRWAGRYTNRAQRRTEKQKYHDPSQWNDAIDQCVCSDFYC